MKKIFSLFVALVAVCSLSAKTLYLNPGVWANEPSRYAIYSITNETWSGMTAVAEAEGIFSGEVADEVTDVVFCRMNPELEANEWASLQNQTEDLNIPEGKDLFSISGWGDSWGAKCPGAWSKFGEEETPVDPDPETPGELPVVELVGVMNDWTPAALTPAEDEKTASIKVELKAMNYEFKIKVAGNWLTLDAGPDAKYEIKRDHNAPEKHFGSPGENTVLVVDVPGEYILTWTYADSTLAVTFPELPEITLSDGYYLIGLTGWSIYALTEDLKLEKNTGLEEGEEYFKKNVVLEEGQEFKVVEVKDKALGAWFGMGEDPANPQDNYKVSADVKGTRDIYFRPEYKADWKGHIFVNWEATAIDNTAVEAKAVKMIENGQIVIIKNGVRYNVLGAQF